MVWRVEWDGQFIVGGDDRRRLTPNFRLQEFKSGDGNFQVHRDLVSALQILRTRFGHSISAREVEADGLVALISSKPHGSLAKAAERAGQQKLFSTTESQEDRVRVAIPDPNCAPPSESVRRHRNVKHFTVLC